MLIVTSDNCLLQSVPEDAVNVHDVKAAYKLLEADGARVIGHLVK